MRRLGIVLLLVMLGAPAWGAIARRQVATCSKDVTGGNVIECTFSGALGAPLEDSVLVACIGRRDGGAATSDIVQTGIDWAAATTVTHSGNTHIDMWVAIDPNASTDPNMQITFGSTHADAVVIAEYTDARLVAPVDPNTITTGKSNCTGTCGASPLAIASGSIPSAAFSQEANMLIGCIGLDGNATYGSPINSFNLAAQVRNPATTISTVLLDKAVVASANQQAGATATGTTTSWAAHFIALKELPTTQTATITPAGAGKGRITSSPIGLSCGATCAFAFDENATVTLTAEPVGDSTFSAWSGDADCTDDDVGNVTTLTMSAARACTATFALKTYYTLTVTPAGTGTGLVRSAGREIDGATLTHDYIDGTIEWLNAYPDAGSVFAGWSGATCTLTSAVDQSITMDQDRACTATFNLESGTSVLYHVRTDGNAACDGLSDAGGSSGACAKSKLSEVFTTMGSAGCTKGDDIIVHAGTYTEQAVGPSICQCPSVDDPNNGPCIIEGVGTTSILDPGAGDRALVLGNTTSGNRTKNVIIKDMRINGGLNANFGCAPGRYCERVVLLDVLATDFAFDGIADVVSPNPPDAAIQFDANVDPSLNILDGVTIDGDEAVCVNWGPANNGARLCGSDEALGGYFNTTGVDVRNSIIRDLQGGALRTGDDTIVQDSLFENLACGEDESGTDDGCFQLYNHDGVIFRRNIFKMSASANNGAYALIRMRRTAVPDGSDNGPTGVTAYNNSMLMPGVCSGTTSACDPQTWGQELVRNAIVTAAAGAGEQRLYGEMNVVRNIFQGYSSTGIGGVSYSLRAQNFTGGGVNICPGGAPGSTTLVWKGDIFWQNETGPDDGGCTGTKDGYDSSGVQIDPGLDGSYEPTEWAEACFPIGSGFTARDGDISDDWVGFSPGACLAVLDTCNNTVKDGDETDIDCGGSCLPCANGDDCLINADCDSNNCVGGPPGICTANSYTLTVSKAGTGTGAPTSSPAGINCGGDCSESYTEDTVVTLTANPTAGHSFDGWSGDADCSDGVVTMTAARACTATFTAPPASSAGKGIIIISRFGPAGSAPSELWRYRLSPGEVLGIWEMP